MSDSSSKESVDGLPQPEITKRVERQVCYVRSSLRVILCLLPFWFLISFGCGILFRDWLDEHAPKIGNAPFGFWMAQQGSIIGFIILLVVYAVWMNRLDRRYRISE
ncbi:DUF4212 domain-containing protein [Pelagicoccus albus]|uniref:DUF4212 domain-containing protein n=1 Tax=Pelagicoccus albus TaxID=415222 RepID=A0A7X1B6E8_9BACT|nr:DUF4212 domain-containing protein [Pelagicoccus albus]MBC2605368.1 DUF4212 domain-containing protein [Pelagicoccus albus]